MTVGELIEALRKFDQNLIVINEGHEDSYTASPVLRVHDFNYTYWDDTNRLQSIPANQQFVSL